MGENSGISTHCFGQWQISLEDPEVIVDEVGLPIAEVDGVYENAVVPEEDRKRIARLISKAPEMYEFIVSCVLSVSLGKSSITYGDFLLLREVIRFVEQDDDELE